MVSVDLMSAEDLKAAQAETGQILACKYVISVGTSIRDGSMGDNMLCVTVEEGVPFIDEIQGRNIDLALGEIESGVAAEGGFDGIVVSYEDEELYCVAERIADVCFARFSDGFSWPVYFEPFPWEKDVTNHLLKVLHSYGDVSCYHSVLALCSPPGRFAQRIMDGEWRKEGGRYPSLPYNYGMLKFALLANESASQGDLARLSQPLTEEFSSDVSRFARESGRGKNAVLAELTCEVEDLARNAHEVKAPFIEGLPGVLSQMADSDR